MGKETIQVVYVNDEIITEDDVEGGYNVSDNNDDDHAADLEHNELEPSASCSSYQPAKLKRRKTNLYFKCIYCRKCFKTELQQLQHMAESHDKDDYSEFPMQCHKCNKGFKSKNGLKGHLKLHEQNVHFQCPMCPAKHLEHYFATHMLTHESATCFPCQVCGKIFGNNDERLKHWETHAREQPYPCNLCYRRYKKHKYLLKHLKCHIPYKCSLCAGEYNATEDQQEPYVCGSCKKKQQARQKTQARRDKRQAICIANKAKCLTLKRKPPETPTNEDSNSHFSYPSTEDESNDDSNEKQNESNVIESEARVSDRNSPENDYNSDLEFMAENKPHTSSQKPEETPDRELIEGQLYIIQTISTPNEGVTVQYKCLQCHSLYSNEKRIICHLAKMHHKYNESLHRFKCPHCCKSFQSKSGLSCHIRTHDENNQYQCPLCPVKEFRSSTFFQHVMTHASHTCFPCQVCAKVFSTNAERVTHYKTHIKEKPYGCKVCYRRFRQDHFLRSHMKAHGVYYCYFCPLHFNSTQRLQSPYVCENCEKLPDIKRTVEHRRALAKSQKHVFESDEEEATKPLKDIKQEEFIEKKDSKEQEQSECEEIIEVFYINDQIDDGIDTISCYGSSDDNEGEGEEDHEDHDGSADGDLLLLDSLSQTCHYCKRAFGSTDALNHHITQEHFKKSFKHLPYKCKQCNKGFKSRSGLTLHSKAHNENFHFKCPVCAVKHKQNYFLTHIMTHESDTCFPCQVCGKLFGSHRERMEHWQTHAKEKPFYCKICYRRFAKKQYLMHHLKTHNRYQCNFCTSVFNSLDSQRAPYVCPNCERLPGIKQSVEHQRSLGEGRECRAVLEREEEHLKAKQTPDMDPLGESCTSNEDSNSVATNTNTPNDKPAEIGLKPPNLGIENKEEYFAITAVNEEESEQQDNKEIIQVIYANDAQSANENDNNETVNTEAISCYTSSDEQDDETDLESNEGYEACASHTQNIRKSKSSSLEEDTDTLTHSCNYCDLEFKTKKGLRQHMFRIHYKNDHKQLPLKCGTCNRGFNNRRAMLIHLKTHDEKNLLQCPVCKAKHQKHYFINHVLTHESDTCFPCQVCGKVYASDDERLKHWQTHAEDRPYVCQFCSRRYERQQYLTHHLKTHCQYQCSLCRGDFNSAETQRSPYVCPGCEDLARAREKLQQQRSGLERDQQNPSASSQHFSNETNVNLFTITPIDSQETQQLPTTEPDNKDNSQIISVKNEAGEKASTETIKEDNNATNAEVNDSDSCYSPNEESEGDDYDLESNEDNEASSSKTKRIKKYKTLSTDIIFLTNLKCPYCRVVFKSKQGCTRHILRNHGNKLPIKCEKCHRGFLNANGLKVHLKAHDHFQCPICKSEHIENYFISHVLTHESDTCFPCQVCGKIYDCQDERQKHWESHAKEKPFACNICYRRYSKLHYLTRHLKFHNQYHCTICSAAFNSLEALRAPYVCEKCAQMPNMRKQVEDLKSVMDKGEACDKEKNLSPCVVPSVKGLEAAEEKQNLLEEVNSDTNTPSTSSINIKAHYQVPDEMDALSNENASDVESHDDSASKSTSLPTHIATGTLSHKCHDCERDFHSKRGLDLHIRQSHATNLSQMDSKHKCLQCQKEFRSRSTLWHHKKTHDKNNQFQCPVCPSRKFGEGSFIVHVMLHENETCFPCQVCGKIFTCNEERMVHWKSHIKERPHGCKVCYRRFAQKHVLLRHLKAHNQ